MVKRKLRAVVTGATRGIGFAVAQKLLDNDIEVIGTGTTLESNVPDGAEFCQADFLLTDVRNRCFFAMIFKVLLNSCS